MLQDIWRSFRALPLWVRLWVAGILVPVNLGSVAFVGQEGGVWVVVLAVGGMAANLPIMVHERGFSRAMAFPHLLCWIPLVIVILITLPGGAPIPPFAAYLWLLLAVDLVSLGFDLRDARDWLRGDRAVTGSQA